MTAGPPRSARGAARARRRSGPAAPSRRRSTGWPDPVRPVSVAGGCRSGRAPWTRASRHRQRHRRGGAGQGVGEHRRGAERRAVAVRPLEQRPAGHVVDASRHARGHLARRARTPVVFRRGREQPGRGPGGPRVAGPVAGQRGVEQPGEVPRVGELRVIGADPPPRSGTSGPGRPGRRRCRARRSSRRRPASSAGRPDPAAGAPGRPSCAVAIARAASATSEAARGGSSGPSESMSSSDSPATHSSTT